MVKPFTSLPEEMLLLGKTVAAGATRAARNVAIGIGGTVVDTTRVDTGKARSNWRGTLNAPASGTIPPYAPGNKLGIGETANAESAKSQQRQAFKKFDATKDRALYITNNVRYIGTLNDGGGLFGPGQMVEQGLQVGRLIISQERILKRGRRR